MCIAVPACVICIEGERAIVESRGNTFSVHIGLVEAREGNYILVHAGCAIQVLAEEEAEDLKNLFEMIEEECRG